MSELNKIVEKYIDFEKRLRAFMDTICAQHCRNCDDVCCRQEFCRETIESPFLSLLREKAPPLETYSSEFGWLTETGCALCMGRAPVCYEFLCTDILASQKTKFDRSMIKVLSALINHLGKNALGPRHLVEILHKEDLHRLRLARFEKRLNDAEAGLNVVTTYLRNQSFDGRYLPILVRITPSQVYVSKDFAKDEHRKQKSIFNN